MMVIKLTKSQQHQSLKQEEQQQEGEENHLELKQDQVEKSTTQPLPHTYFVHPAEKDILVEEDNESYLPILGKKAKDYFVAKNKARAEDSKNGIIHIGNLTTCMRQSMLLEKYADQIDYTIWDYTDFMDGLDSEKIIVHVLNHGRLSTDGSTGEFQKDLVFDDFIAHPDYIDDEDDVIFELKSTKKIKPFILSEDTITKYVRQIVYYMILNNMEKGRVLARYALPFFPTYVKVEDEIKMLIKGITVEDNLYVLKFHRETGQFPFYSVRLELKKDGASRDRVKMGLVDIIKPLYQAGDIEKVPILDDKETNWHCNKYCKVKQICDQTPDLQTDPAVRYVVLNKHIDAATNKVKRFGRRKDKDVVIT